MPSHQVPILLWCDKRGTWGPRAPTDGLPPSGGQVMAKAHFEPNAAVALSDVKQSCSWSAGCGPDCKAHTGAGSEGPASVAHSHRNCKAENAVGDEARSRVAA